MLTQYLEDSAAQENSFSGMLQSVATFLSKWNKETFGNISKETSKLKGGLRIAGVGGIIRSPTRTLIEGYAGKVYASNSLEAELLAIIKGMEICLKRGFNHVIIEGDCLSLTQSLQKYNNLSWALMAHWRKLLNMLSQVSWWEANYCRRTANKVADQLSKLYFPEIATFKSYLPLGGHELYIQDLQVAASYRQMQVFAHRCSNSDSIASSSNGIFRTENLIIF
ncbi:hypothetical protein MRB53_006393 [Persea americana]|uniref:Uncharacterized protein n=1 Tax=Persea americana TaxID=3435 RepID=A0ACC2MGT8_PERAE|nr:hypothetical protein MRB53_006393 [Persea americana]